jgi:hypothetical protein
MSLPQHVRVAAGCLWILACQSHSQGGPTFPPLFYFDDEGNLVRVERDANQDGRIDRWDYHEGPYPYRIELDSDYDGVVDLWAKIGSEGEVVQLRRDSDGDGIPDEQVPSEEAPFRAVEPSFALQSPPGSTESQGQDGSLSPACLDYLRALRTRVYSRWGPQGTGGDVTVRFQVAEDGRLNNVAVVKASSTHLATTCLQAVQEAGALGSVPEPCAELVAKESVLATFRYRRGP